MAQKIWMRIWMKCQIAAHVLHLNENAIHLDWCQNRYSSIIQICVHIWWHQIVYWLLYMIHTLNTALMKTVDSVLRIVRSNWDSCSSVYSVTFSMLWAPKIKFHPTSLYCCGGRNGQKSQNLGLARQYLR